MSTQALNEIGKVYERPWGTYKTLDIGDGYQVKIIEVKPGGRLSLQKHFKRAEHWVVIKGTPTITVGDKTEQLVVNQGVFIPVTTIHRLENFTDQPAAIIEVQVGSYLGEDDIERLDDIYSRK
ncbi:MAG: phosphomannose isomerase type II C-terminal cupin domain [Gammaproteobacteria bacterium]|jgi:mannose-6-phosphate isomerase-like protein (cupin superfamily)